MTQALKGTDALDAIVAESEVDEDNDKEGQLAIGAKTAVEVIGRRKYFDLRDKWSGWIIIWISSLILFNGCITVAVGAKWLDYSDYEWFITAVIVQTFLQIVGLGAIAVGYLFGDGKA